MMNLMKTENTHEETDRRTRALAQARRIEAYLPTLEERERRLLHELEELRTLIVDERAALEDLVREAHREP
jgi:23S rRNA maturation mini-RNase III